MRFATLKRRTVVAIGVACASALVLTACTGDAEEPADEGNAIVIGTTDRITSIDPAGSYDTGSFAVMAQVYPFLMNTPQGSPEVEPDIAVSAEFITPTEYQVVLKEGLSFANGNALTASDVKFSFDRQLAIKGADGPAALLYNLAGVEEVDETTVVFTLKQGNDQIFPQILSSPAGAIVDEQIFSATEVTSDEQIVEGNAFAGQYSITEYEPNERVEYTASTDYQGMLGTAVNEKVVVNYYTDASKLKTDVQEGEVDVAFRSLPAADIEALRTSEAVTVHQAPGGAIRFIAFNFDTQPFGATSPEPDPAKALAVRQAVASLLDREQLAEQVYNGTYLPLYSHVPAGLTGATEALKGRYGDLQGGSDAAAAAELLSAAGITTPVDLALHYAEDRFGPSSKDEFALIESQLEADGLFAVELQAEEGEDYNEDRIAGAFPAFQLGWSPDYSDADSYLTMYLPLDSFLATSYVNPELSALIVRQAVTVDAAERTALIAQVQEILAADVPTVPYLQGSQLVVAGNSITGVQLDASSTFRYATLAR